MFSLFVTLAYAGDLETFVGGGVSAGVTAFSESGVASADALTTQAEVNAAVGWGWGHARFDLDLHIDPNAFGVEGADVVAYPTMAFVGDSEVPMPEWAMVQFGRDQHIRLGVLNPNIGLEDWDPWVNYAPVYSHNFVYVGSGRFLGTDIGMSLESGYDLFVFGGYDVDWGAVGGGVGAAAEQDSYSTWSGIVVYPQFNVGCPDGEATCLNAFAQLALEVYPADPLWIAIEAYPGIKGGSFYTTTQLVANIVPEATVNPFVRGELILDPDGVSGAPGHSASVGARTDVPEWLRAMVEARVNLLRDGTVDPGVALTLAVHRPDPNPYSFTDPFGAEEEE